MYSFLMAACSDSAPPPPTGGPSITGVVITPSENSAFLTGYIDPVLPVGAIVSYTATAYYDDNSSEDVTDSVTWDIGETEIMEHLGGTTVRTVSSGKSEIAANYQGIRSNTSLLSVIDAEIENIEITSGDITLEQGTTHQFKAVASFYGTDSKLDVTKQVLWASDDFEALDIEFRGGFAAAHSNKENIPVYAIAKFSLDCEDITDCIDGDGLGEHLDGIFDSVTVTVSDWSEGRSDHIYMTPNQVEIPVGYTHQLDIFRSNPETQNPLENMNHATNWVTNDSNLVTVETTSSIGERDAENPGRVTAVAPGIVEVTGQYRFNAAHLFTSEITVNSNTLENIHLVPTLLHQEESSFDANQDNYWIPEGLATPIIAIGVFTNDFFYDITNDVKWHSSNATIIAVDDKNVLRTLKEGSATLTVTSNNFTRDFNIVVEEAKVLKVDIVDYASDTLAPGVTMQYKAVAKYNNGSRVDVTDKVNWLSSNSHVADFNFSHQKRGVISTYEEWLTDVTASIKIREGSEESVEASTTLRVMSYFGTQCGPYQHRSLDTSDGLTFTCPLTTNEAQQYDVEYSSLNDYYQYGKKWALMTETQGEAYCVSQAARLATESELLVLANEHGHSFGENKTIKWPASGTERPDPDQLGLYWSSAGTVVNMAQPDGEYESITGIQLVSCVYNAN